jgi:hypothetical protein
MLWTDVCGHWAFDYLTEWACGMGDDRKGGKSAKSGVSEKRSIFGEIDQNLPQKGCFLPKNCLFLGQFWGYFWDVVCINYFIFRYMWFCDRVFHRGGVGGGVFMA